MYSFFLLYFPLTTECWTYLGVSRWSAFCVNVRLIANISTEGLDGGSISGVSPGRTLNQGVFDSHRNQMDVSSAVKPRCHTLLVAYQLLICHSCCTVGLSRCRSGLSCTSTLTTAASVALCLNSWLKGQFGIYLSTIPTCLISTSFLNQRLMVNLFSIYK